MKIPNNTLLYKVFSSRELISSLVDVTESMWPTTDKNIELLHSLIVRASTSYFGHAKYLSVCEKVANIMYIIAKNHDFENGNKRTAIVVAYVTMMLNGLQITIGANKLHATIIEVVNSELPEKDRIINQVSTLLEENTEPFDAQFDKEGLDYVSDDIQ